VNAIAAHQVKGAPQLYGPAREFWRYKGVEVILSGPYETGKTFAWVSKLHALCVKYPKSQAVMFRQTYKSLLTTVVQTYENKVLPMHPDLPDSPIKKLGKSKPELYTYPNGSVIYVVGLDNPDKLLSGEFDFAGGAQLEEITLNSWEKILSRLTGRSGNTPYTQLMGDCNPGHPKHWILERESLKVFTQLHRYNPTLYDQDTGELTAQGERTMRILQSLTGLRYKRGYLGQWAGVEGAVYEAFDPAVHTIEAFNIPDDWRLFRVIDFGYTNPFVCQWWAMDHDGRLYMYREIYMSRRTVADHADQINRLTGNERIEFTIADSAGAEERATLAQHGIHTRPSKKGKDSIQNGINQVQMRLRDAGDGKPRLFLFDNATVEIDNTMVDNKRPTSTAQEFLSYSYPDGVDGKPNKETPIDVDNHGLDATRYLVEELERPITTTLELPDIFGRD
jgi:PBSX family phage terminase large subunit